MTGIVGIGRGVGTTHFSVMLANYLAGVKQRKVAVLEWNRSKDFMKMAQVCCYGQKTVADPAEILEVFYFGDAGKEELLQCLDQEYQDIIIDFGDHYEDVRTEFLRCDRRYVVLSMSEWQIGAFVEFARDYRGDLRKGLEYLAAFGSEEARREVMKELNLSILRIPYSVDAMIVTGDVINFFKYLL